MSRYLIKRLLLAIPVLLGILIVTFILARSIPGEPCRAMLGEKATEAVCERFKEKFGFNKPIYVQLWIYIKEILSGNFGDSIRYSRPVLLILIERLPMTIELSLFALLIAILIGVPGGILSSIKRNSVIDVITMVGANIGISMPVYWLGLMLAYVFGLKLLGTPFWLPPSGRMTAGVSVVPFYQLFGWIVEKGSLRYYILEFLGNLHILNSVFTQDWSTLKDATMHLILPALALSTIPLSIIARMTRSSMLEVLKQDYIRAAQAKGLKRSLVILKHALRNALIPIITVIGLQMGTLFSGAVLTETIFGLAGVGRMMFEAITARDFPIIQGFTVAIAIGYVFINLLVDIFYLFIDPRIRLE